VFAVLCLTALTALGREYVDQEHVLADEIIVIEKPPVYPVVDAHAHFGASEECYELAVKTMDNAGIKTTVVLGGGYGERLDRHLELAAKYPGRFLVFCGVGVPREERSAENTGEIFAAQLQEAHEKGAAGFGEIVRWAMRPGGLAWDDPKLDPMWSKLEELKMPVNWHVADPSRYWRPEGPFNTLVVIAAHSNYLADMVPLLEWRLRKFPNYHCDLSATIGEWGRVPEEFKYMVTEYSDRFLYGTDAGYREGSIEMFGEGDIDAAAHNMAAFHLAHFLFLGTSQRNLPIPFHGNYGRTLIRWQGGYTRYIHDGVDLPPEVLEKIYYKNAEKLFRIEVEGWQPPEPLDWRFK